MNHQPGRGAGNRTGGPVAAEAADSTQRTQQAAEAHSSHATPPEPAAKPRSEIRGIS